MTLQTDAFAELVRHPRLPTPPAVALRVLEVSGQPDCTVAQLAQVIGNDPALCNRVLVLANSAFFGFSGRISTLTRALSLLGMKQVRSLVMALSMSDMEKNASKQAARLDYWKSSLGCALAMRELAQRARALDVEDDFVAGLLCDIGSLALAEVFAADYQKVHAEPALALALARHEVEKRVFGFDHAEAGAWLLEQWRLPKALVEAVRHHHRPQDGEAATQARALRLNFAGVIGQLYVMPNTPALVRHATQLAAQHFSMNEEAFGAFFPPLTQKIEDFAALLRSA